VTVRSEEKGQRILASHQNVSKEKISYTVVADVAQEQAFDEVSSISFTHTHSFIQTQLKRMKPILVMSAPHTLTNVDNKSYRLLKLHPLTM